MTRDWDWLGPKEGYVETLDRVTEANNKEVSSQPPIKNPLRPSSAGNCTRELAYQYEEYRAGKIIYPLESRPANVCRLLKLGFPIERHIIWEMKVVDIFEIKYEQAPVTFMKISDSELIEGSIDFAVYTTESKGVLDAKSKGDKFSSFYSSGWDEYIEKFEKMKSAQVVSEKMIWIDNLEAFLKELTDPYLASNFYQLNLYACTDFMKDRGIDHGSVIQYNKNNSKMRELRFRPSQAVSDQVKRKFKTVMEAVDVKKDPSSTPKDFLLGNVKCAFCRFKTKCWPDATRKDHYKNLPPKKWPKDTDRLKNFKAIEEDYFEYKDSHQAEKKRRQFEERVIIALQDQGVNKVRFSDGHVYDIRTLKTEGKVLRRTKL